MAEKGEILYQHQQGQSMRGIARSLGLSRNTVRQLIARAKAHGYQGPATSVEQLDAIVRAMAMPVPIRRLIPNAQATVTDFLSSHHDVIATYLSQPHMTIRQCLRLLVEEYGYEGSETSLRRYIKQAFSMKPRPVIPLPTQPGHQGQVDFGYVGMMFCPVEKRRRKAYAFVMTLSHSRHRFVYFTFKQNSQTWVDCHRRAFEFFGGVPKSILLDNLKAGVITPNIYDPTLNKGYAECEKHYGFIADPAKVRKPEHKGKVERSILIVKQQIISGRTFTDIRDANTYAWHWCAKVIANRVTRTTGETPLVRFERDEKACLKPLPIEPFDPPHWQSCQVQRDAHITYKGSFYSVPHNYIGKVAWVRATTRMVDVYSEHHQLLATHPKASRKGQWHTHWCDLPKAQREYVLQTAEQLRSLAAHLGEDIHHWVDSIIGDTLTETIKRKVNALLRLANEYPVARLNAACKRALSFNNKELSAIKTILENRLEVAPIDSPSTSTLSGRGTFLHDPQDFYLH